MNVFSNLLFLKVAMSLNMNLSIFVGGIPSVVLPPQRAGMAPMAGIQHPSSPPAVQAGVDQSEDHAEDDGKIKVIKIIVFKTVFLLFFILT